MLRYIGSRILQSLLVLWVVVTLAFVMMKSMKTDPFASEKAASPYVVKQNKEIFGLDKPLIVQYGLYIKNALKGELGWSLKYEGLSVSEIIRSSFPVSLRLGLFALALALAIGVPIGVIAAVKKNGLWDHLPMSLAMLGICLPTFVMGPLLSLGLGLRLGWFNVAGLAEWSDWVLPSLTIGLFYSAYFARMAREGMLEALSQDYIRTAKAKGVPGWRIVIKHALRAALLPLLSVLGPAMAGLVVGSFVVERVFQIPGLGQHFTEAAMTNDYSLVLGTTAFYCALLVGANLVVDLLQVMLNPRLKFSN